MRWPVRFKRTWTKREKDDDDTATMMVDESFDYEGKWINEIIKMIVNAMTDYGIRYDGNIMIMINEMMMILFRWQ